MYSRETIISSPVGNNVFSYEERSPRTDIVIPALIQGDIEDVKEGTSIVFEEVEEGKLRSCQGLAHQVEFKYMGVPVYVGDNHNLVYAAWCRALMKGQIQPGAVLYHVDQHRDMRHPPSVLPLTDCYKEEEVTTYTNEVLNVGTFIQPALANGLLSEVIFLDKEADFQQAYHLPENAIVDIDLDIFAEHLSYLNFERVVATLRAMIPQASLVTFATSPFFIDQASAISFLRKLL